MNKLLLILGLVVMLSACDRKPEYYGYENANSINNQLWYKCKVDTIQSSVQETAEAFMTMTVCEKKGNK